MYVQHLSFNLIFSLIFFRENNHTDYNQEEDNEEEEEDEDINLEDKSDFEKHQILVNIIFILLSQLSYYFF